MSISFIKIKRTVATLSAIVMFSIPATAQDASDLLQQLREAEPAQAQRAANRVINAWSKSGSAAMDLLLKRGRDALDVKKYPEAVGHLRALTDHAPDFAEGWHTLALVYFQQEKFGLALDALERTLALNPQHFGAMRGLGAVLERTGHKDLAYRAYQKSLDLHPHDAEVLKAVERLDPEISGTAL